MPNTDNTEKDELTLSIENNPCGTCRANGLPLPCAGHGGGAGGGSGSGGSSEKTDSKSSSNSSTNNTSANRNDDISSQFLDGKCWSQLKWLDNELKFDKPEALLSIQMNKEQGTLIFDEKKGLSKEQEKILHEHFNAIKSILEEFKQELKAKGISVDDFTAVTKDNKLTIKIPPEHFSAFIARLVDKNLLPTKNLLQQKVQENKYETSNQIPDTKSTFNPSPFSKEPKPKGWKE